MLGALVLSLLSLTGNAGVVAIDVNNDGTTDSFYDGTNHLLWSDANIWGQQSLSNANTLVSSSNIEELSIWHLPTIAQFQTLYSDFSANPKDKQLFHDIQSLWY